MKKYENLDNFYPREHLLEITLQLGEYKGTLRQKITGNCFGLDILHSFDVETFDPDDLCYNDCELTFIGEDDEGEEWFSCVLKNEKGETCEHEATLRELAGMIVKLEIIDCKIRRD